MASFITKVRREYRGPEHGSIEKIILEGSDRPRERMFNIKQARVVAWTKGAESGRRASSAARYSLVNSWLVSELCRHESPGM